MHSFPYTLTCALETSLKTVRDTKLGRTRVQSNIIGIQMEELYIIFNYYWLCVMCSCVHPFGATLPHHLTTSTLYIRA